MASAKEAESERPTKIVASAPTKKRPAESAATKSSTKKPARAKLQSASSAVDEQLARYRSMRDFGVTAEPSGARSGKSPVQNENRTTYPFCIQKHASRICTMTSSSAGTACSRVGRSPRLATSCRTSCPAGAGRRPPHGIRRLRGRHPQGPVWRAAHRRCCSGTGPRRSRCSPPTPTSRRQPALPAH